MNSSNDAHISDQELLEQFYATRSNKLLGALLQRYTLLLLGVCMKYLKDEEEAKDAVQQIFLKAITELQKYKVEYIKSWLYMVARNHCLMKLRDKHIITREVSELLAADDDQFLKASAREQDILLAYMEEALEQLNPEQKSCVTLFYLQKKSYTEISANTGLSLLQVKSFIQNGKRNLKLLIEKKQKQKNA